MTAYYNEHDPYAAQWIRNLIAAGHIAPGDVDERSIEDVRPDELAGYTQCHFFAGIGVWSYALRRAGWPDDRPIWTGSCPCQPFSQTGRGEGFADERHLWPALHWLIQQRRPSVFFGEQVSSKNGLAWLDVVQADMENTGYAIGSIDLCSASVGAPHIRQRTFIAAERLGDALGEGLEGHSRNGDDQARRPEADGPTTKTGDADRVADTSCKQHNRAGQSGSARRSEYSDSSAACGMADTELSSTARLGELGRQGETSEGIRSGSADSSEPSWPGPVNGIWRDADWLGCRDGKWRPVEPGTSPMADGIANRVGRLRAYGNAINAEQATEFIKTYLDIRGE